MVQLYPNISVEAPGALAHRCNGALLAKSKMAAVGSQNDHWDLEQCLTLDFWELLSHIRGGTMCPDPFNIAIAIFFSWKCVFLLFDFYYFGVR